MIFFKITVFEKIVSKNSIFLARGNLLYRKRSTWKSLIFLQNVL